VQKQHLRCFQMEVQFQCDLALRAFDDLEQAVVNLIDNGGMSRLRAKQAIIWLALQGFLVASANISKLFWPTQRKKVFIPDRGKELKESLGIADDSPINSRDLRNHLEHFDERLEEWTSLGTNMVNRCIGDDGSFDTTHPKACLGTLNQTTFKFKFYNDELDLPCLREAILVLRDKVAEEVMKPWF
jgi:hypothetical protein